MQILEVVAVDFPSSLAVLFSVFYWAILLKANQAHFQILNQEQV